MEQEIEIPALLIESLLILAAEQELPVEDIVTRAITNYMERNDEIGRRQ